MAGRQLDPQMATVRRLVKTSKRAPLVHETPDGAVELVVVGKGVLQHYHVDPHSSTILLETADNARQWLIGQAIFSFGLVLFAAALVGGPILKYDATQFLLLGIAGFLLVWVGGVVSESSLGAARQGASLPGGWSRLESLLREDDWAPLSYTTLAQLKTIEKLTLQHGRWAAVREARDWEVDVVTAEARVSNGVASTARVRVPSSFRGRG